MQLTQQQLLNLFWHNSDKINNKESFLFFGKETFIIDEKTKLELPQFMDVNIDEKIKLEFPQFIDVNKGIANNNIFKIYDIIGEIVVADKRYYFIVYND